jgi:NTE family protein
MIGGTLENTTSSDFRVSAAARFLAFDTVGSGSELRIDAQVGSDAHAAVELYRPIGPTPLFVAPYAGVTTSTLDLVDDDIVVARYRETIPAFGLNVGVNLGVFSDLRVGAFVRRRGASVETGDVGFPSLSGKESSAELLWRFDTQDSTVVPTKGLYSRVRLKHVFDGATLSEDVPFDYDLELTQLSWSANQMWSIGRRGRLFAYGSLGTSFDDTPLPSDAFELGAPFSLGAFDRGELRGAHAYVATGGYLRQIGRLPDFLGGPVFIGGWLENGDAFDDWDVATLRSNGGAGLVLDTIVGPMVVAGVWGFDGRWRTYLNIGRTFR